jgi:hypothetical protein
MRALVGAVATAALLAASGCTSGVTTTTDTSQVVDSLSAQEAPPARTGDLGVEDLPRPRDLGPGWMYRVDLGNPEDGYRGSGEPAIARDPASVLAAITPLGCRPARLPMPERALEVTYARGQQPAVALILRFANDSSAANFFAGHSGVIRDCTDSRRVDVTVHREAGAIFVSSRTEQLGETPSWTEGARLSGDEVMLVAVAESSRSAVQSVLAALNGA